ncbi:MAG: VCBS repeat-containing protein [Polyangiaceae bacterium]
MPMPGCTQPLPLDGKCVKLPPACDASGNPPGCVNSMCEYHPPVGQLNAVSEWVWGQNGATIAPSFVDVWSTPVVGRVHDNNCDGKVDELDSPVVVFVSGDDLAGNANGTNCQSAGGTPSMCHKGVLRMLDGTSGAEIWSLQNDGMGSMGFAGMSVALGDIDNDGVVDVVAVTGEGYIELIDSTGAVKRKSDQPIGNNTAATFGWGGGLSIADMDGDGFAEIAFGSTVYTTTNNAITRKFVGANGIGSGGVDEALSSIVDLDGAPDNHLELLVGNSAYRADGTQLWQNGGVNDGFVGVGDFNLDANPDVALVGAGKLWILNGATGAITLGPVTLPGTGSGGPPTIADFDGDGKPEVGVAMATFYSVLKPDYTNNKINVLWQTPNHDLSSSVTGSTVFDFEGDGKAEVIYGDECFLWVFDGPTGAVRFAAPHTSFTGTEASLVADVDGDGHAEILMVTNGASPTTWGCLDGTGQPVTVNGVTWTPSALPNKSYRGIVSFGDVANSWVGTRTLWNEHAYHVSNVCDDRDSACDAPNLYGSIPKLEKRNWMLPWLNNFRQNVQDGGLFDAPDATASLKVPCVTPIVAQVSVRNSGLSALPTDVPVAVFKVDGAGLETQVGTSATTHPLSPGQTETLMVPVDGALATTDDTFLARVVVDPVAPKFHECDETNNDSGKVTPSCVQ